MRFCTVNGLDKPCFKVYNAQTCIQWFDNMIHMWYKGDIRFGDMGFGPSKITMASYKCSILHYPPHHSTIRMSKYIISKINLWINLWITF